MMQNAHVLPLPESRSVNETRVIRQLLEALMFERQLDFVMYPMDNSDQCYFDIEINHTRYSLSGYCGGFDRIRLDSDSIHSSQLTLEDIIAACDCQQTAAAILQAELAQTIHFCDWNQQHMLRPRDRRQLSWQQLEQHIVEGHPYHPSFKSRTNFSLADHRLYGPEVGRRFQLHWLAVRRELATHCLPCGEFEFWMNELGSEQWHLLDDRLRLLDADWDEYLLLPIHPWQWLNLRGTQLQPLLEKRDLLYLAAAGDSYQASQSVRTLLNHSQPNKANVKLPLNMVNTSSLRKLEPHSVCTAPAISAWLQQIVAADAFLDQHYPLLIVPEYAGILVETDNPALSGQLAVIWRESLDCHIQPDESAIPFNSLFLIENDGLPFIEPWVQQYGLQRWLTQLFDTSILPVWHLLLQHGIAIEAHSQNLILLHQQGWPNRLAARDFHESVEFVDDFLRSPELKPAFSSLNPLYQGAADNTYFWMSEVDALRELLVDTLFIYNLSELAHVCFRYYRLPESRFWQLVNDSLNRYSATVAIDPARLERLGMQQQQFQTESLLTRKLRYPNQDECHHQVSNPFYSKTAG